MPVDSPSDKELLKAAIKRLKPNCWSYYRPGATIDSIGRWGSCIQCPRENGVIVAERCVNTGRWDHEIDWTRDGKFRVNGRDYTREGLIKFLAS